jgi:hypothetical protein
MRANQTVASIRPKQFVGAAVGSDQVLSFLDLFAREIGLRPVTNRDGMSEGVIPDPVAGRPRLAHERRCVRIQQIGPDHEEGRLQTCPVEDVQNTVGDPRNRSIVECQSDLLHVCPRNRSDDAIPPSAEAVGGHLKLIDPEQTSFPVVEVHEVEAHLQVASAGDGNLPPPVSQTFQARLEQRPSDDIKHHVSPVACRRRRHQFVSGPVCHVDEVIDGEVWDCALFSPLSDRPKHLGPL